MEEIGTLNNQISLYLCLQTNKHSGVSILIFILTQILRLALVIE